ncbi:MAG: hypothetical protein K1V81_01910 [Paramuribaculum sp.]|jgi:hypothetical protein
MGGPLSLPIVILVFVLFAWKIISLHINKRNSSQENNDMTEEEANLKKFLDMSDEERKTYMENEYKEIMVPIFSAHKGYSSAEFFCFVSDTRDARNSHLVDVGDKVELKLKNDEIRVYADFGNFLGTICVPKTSPIWAQLKKNCDLDAYLSGRSYNALAKENEDSFEITVFYKERS